MRQSKFFSLSPAVVGRFDDSSVVEALCTARRLSAQLEAIELRVVHRLTELRSDLRSVVDEVALELCLSKRAAEDLVRLARDVMNRLPNVLGAMEAGTLSRLSAAKISDVVAPLPDELVSEVDVALVDRITDKNAGQIRRITRDLVHKVDPEGAEARARARRSERRIEIRHREDAMAQLLAVLPVEVASTIYARVNRIARTMRSRKGKRTADQIRADVFAELLLGERTGAPRAEVFIHVAADAALGITDRAAELVGHGPIPASVARDIMKQPNSVWRKVITDPGSGAPLDVGRSRYRPPAHLADYVRVRDRVCRMPGCHHPAQCADLDHHRARAKGGDTSCQNLCVLCRSHHRLKDAPGWKFDLDRETGELTITTPADRTRTTKPTPLFPPAEHADAA
ncbi:HNH endonuclease signature motif containing protein [Amycolatopsis magusensis]|uniref:DUF222 domain-containing protein n=1 Tax=Amycolatopsis magusensis TaxID=882444 RepID=A0ABS4Q289_9PSEU|nr:HNH endonuclease signature motif containing protein [Amycolatopsis magusensis]MBP2185804.1 hypothetical protein [Amycolatopsis magusensis]